MCTKILILVLQIMLSHHQDRPVATLMYVILMLVNALMFGAKKKKEKKGAFLLRCVCVAGASSVHDGSSVFCAAGPVTLVIDED